MEEQKRNAEMISIYESELEKLPKGNLIIKKISNNEYYYLKYRKNKKVKTDYVGKDNKKAAMIQEQIRRRNHYENMLSALISEQNTISKILEELL